MTIRLPMLLPCVPIAPLPVPTTSVSVSAFFAASQLGPRDVLLKKGGRPTHGKKEFFERCQASAPKYASLKSPIDRRLLARQLVDDWLAQGGRFCASQPAKSTDAAGFYRVASSEEALQFTRRVLVRHFTPTLNKGKRKRRSPSMDSNAASLAAVDMEEAKLDAARSEAVDALCFLSTNVPKSLPTLSVSSVSDSSVSVASVSSTSTL